MMSKFRFVLIVAVIISALGLLLAQKAESKKDSKVAVYELVAVKKSKNPRKFSDFAWRENGKQRWLSDVLKEGKVVLLNFWGTWCPPCRRELPDIAELAREMQSEVFVVGVAFERGRQKMQKLQNFVARAKLPYVNVTTEDGNILGQISTAYGGVGVVPTTFIIAPDGTIVAKLIGAQQKSTFQQYVKKAQQK